MGKKFGLLFFLLLLILPLLSAKIWVNEPKLGQTLEVLVENQSLDNLTLRHPDGTLEVLSLQDGQLSYPINQSGRWELEADGQKWSWTVAAEGGSGPLRPGDARPDALGPMALLALVLVLLALAGLAVYFLVFKAPAAQPPALEKTRKNGNVRIRLRAGTRPLAQVSLEDSDGAGRKLRRERLRAGEALEMQHEWEGDMGEARATFELDGRKRELRVREGVQALETVEMLVLEEEQEPDKRPLGRAGLPERKAGGPKSNADFDRAGQKRKLARERR
ncbi:Uncharacterised protein [uncultured archaeon]|nr:Uncharacterised protein [uncultured archaeon]